MNKSHIIMNILFIMIGLIGIIIHFMQTNYFLLIGSLGIICIVLSQHISIKKLICKR